MTHFAPVTIATRPCKSSRSRSGEIFDAELPIAVIAYDEWVPRSGRSCRNHSQGRGGKLYLWVRKLLGSELYRDRPEEKSTIAVIESYKTKSKVLSETIGMNI